LLAIVLGGPTPSPRAQSIAGVLATVPVWRARALGVDGVVSEYGIPRDWASRVMPLYELIERRWTASLPAVESTHDAVFLFDDLRRSSVEKIAVLLLDGCRRSLGVEIVAVGSINRASVLPSDVLASALRAGTASIVVAHCHPSGNPRPSRADREHREPAAGRKSAAGRAPRSHHRGAGRDVLVR
jgi:hypothetical protein